MKKFHIYFAVCMGLLVGWTRNSILSLPPSEKSAEFHSKSTIYFLFVRFFFLQPQPVAWCPCFGRGKVYFHQNKKYPRNLFTSFLFHLNSPLSVDSSLIEGNSKINKNVHFLFPTFSSLSFLLLRYFNLNRWWCHNSWHCVVCWRETTEKVKEHRRKLGKW